MTEIATLGGGCFWCLEAVFERVRGVKDVVSGYAGGHVDNPGYREVCAGTTGHAEVVQIEFDAAEISFRDLLDVFFAIHDPTTQDRQGADIGSQYRSIILWHDESQREVASRTLEELAETGAFDDPIVTELMELETFYPAEDHHQGYYDANRSQPYCRLVIDPKVQKLLRGFPEKVAD